MFKITPRQYDYAAVCTLILAGIIVGSLFTGLIMGFIN
jgi:hypothetical protein